MKMVGKAKRSKSESNDYTFRISPKDMFGHDIFKFPAIITFKPYEGYQKLKKINKMFQNLYNEKGDDYFSFLIDLENVVKKCDFMKIDYNVEDFLDGILLLLIIFFHKAKKNVLMRVMIMNGGIMKSVIEHIKWMWNINLLKSEIY